ncbi:hypothetical protein NSP_18170 [Nodularia spumigena CCY9414]|nr:hypothetical protein NSP_18170 [Nodularia spumigena CCY9414]
MIIFHRYQGWGIRDEENSSPVPMSPIPNPSILDFGLAILD